MSYYERALEVRPEDHIALNNIGANLMQLGKVNEAQQYFEQALSINSDYPNTLYGLGMIYDDEGNHLCLHSTMQFKHLRNANQDILYTAML